ncbi:TetR/AcrR family transcriptional regulator, partial [Treponema peruense]
MEKEPEEIGMREIAKKCGVSATAIYHYYRDKDCLFQSISL